MNTSSFRFLPQIFFACMLAALPAMADSQARIVRLSEVQGAVKIDKNSGLGFENAFLNLPITQGTKLRTGDRGRAEIEFEDGSTMRLTPNTTVEFSSLALDAGKRNSEVSVTAGRAYVNWVGKSGDVCVVNLGNEKLNLVQPEHIRVAALPNAVEVASFKSDVQVEGPAGVTKVEKKKMVTFSEDDAGTSVAKLEALPEDSWDKELVSYHDQYSKKSVVPLGYGAGDLNYYGSYNNVTGYGTLWQPFFAGAGWNPYMDGAWSYYPGAGYMWASAYPWGWLPYNYGNWVYAPGFGWGWQQPSSFSSWHGGLHYVGAVSGFTPPAAPKGTVSPLVVGKSAAASSVLPAHLVLNNGSAGLGVPRGAVAGLHQLNSEVARHGQVQLSNTTSAASSRSGWASPSYGSAATGSRASVAASASNRSSATPSSAHSSGVSVGGHR